MAFNFPIGTGNKPAAKPTEKPMAKPMHEEPDGDEGAKPDVVHVHNNHDGTYHTQHEPDGAEHDHENLEALKQHFDQFLSDEAGEGGEKEDWE